VAITADKYDILAAIDKIAAFARYQRLVEGRQYSEIETIEHLMTGNRARASRSFWAFSSALQHFAFEERQQIILVVLVVRRRFLRSLA